MNKEDIVVVIKNNDGTVAILSPAMALFDPTSRDRENLAALGITLESDEEVLQWIINKDVPAGKQYRVCTRDKLPSDRVFRNAWTDDNPTETVDVDVVKARGIIREKRNRKLEELDKKAFAESRKPNGNKEAVDAEAQRLRDIPQDARFQSDDISVLKELHDEI